MNSSLHKLDDWSDRNKVSLLLILSGLAFIAWFSTYLTIPYPAIFGDEFSTYALTRAVADPQYNLKDDGWVYNMRGSMYVFSFVYQLVHLREGNPLVVAQFLNALCLASTTFLAWAVARKFLSASASFGVTMLYVFSATHILGAHFILEPLFYFGFWAVLLTTFLAVGGSAPWSLAAGALCCVLCFIKPHGMVSAGWSLLLLVSALLIPDSSLRNRLLRLVYWVVGFLALQFTFRWLSGGASSDTVKGGGFYGSVFHEFSQPAVFLKYLHSALSSLLAHMGFYALIYGFVFGLAVVALLQVLLFPKWVRRLETKDLFALSLPLLAAALLCMALAYSSFVQETLRVHARYWSYTLVPVLIGGIYFTTHPLVSFKAISRIAPLCFVAFAAWFIFLGRPGNLQLFPNDCPEVYWLYLGASHPAWYRTLIVVVTVASAAAAVLYIFKQRAGLIAAIAVMLACSVLTGHFGIDFLRRHSIANGVQTRLSGVLQSYKNEVLSRSVIIITPQSYMAGGAMFGLPRIPTILLLPAGSVITAAEIPAQFTVVSTIGEFTLPPEFVRTWSEAAYSIYVRSPSTAPAKP